MTGVQTCALPIFGLYDRFLPGHFWPQTWLNTAIAFCCAVEPSAVSWFLPPQSADELDEPDAPVVEEEPELLSLPHAVSVIPVIAVADKVTKNALPNLFRSTYPTFSSVAVFAPSGAHTHHRERMRRWWTEPTRTVNSG